MGRKKTDYHHGYGQRNWTNIVLKEAIKQTGTKNLAAKTQNGSIKKTSVTSALIEKMFLSAINGDVKAQKQLLIWAKQYLQVPPENPLRRFLNEHDVTQTDVDVWDVAGCLPVGCSKILDEISTTDLNKALKLYRKKFGKKYSFPWPMAEKLKIRSSV